MSSGRTRMRRTTSASEGSDRGKPRPRRGSGEGGGGPAGRGPGERRPSSAIKERECSGSVEPAEGRRFFVDPERADGCRLLAGLGRNRIFPVLGVQQAVGRGQSGGGSDRFFVHRAE